MDDVTRVYPNYSSDSIQSIQVQFEKNRQKSGLLMVKGSLEDLMFKNMTHFLNTIILLILKQWKNGLQYCVHKRAQKLYISGYWIWFSKRQTKTETN